MADTDQGLPCAVCGRRFETLDAFDRHLPCDRPTQWKEPKFREVGSEEPQMRDANFIEAYADDPGGARWASETTRERVDAGLRSRRIRALTADRTPVPNKSTWKRFYEWLMK